MSLEKEDSAVRSYFTLCKYTECINMRTLRQRVERTSTRLIWEITLHVAEQFLAGTG